MRSLLTIIGALSTIISISCQASVPESPVAVAKVLTEGLISVGQTVLFDGTDSFCPPESGTVAEYYWVFPPQAYCIDGDRTATPSCKFFPETASGQQYEIKLYVRSSVNLWSQELIAPNDDWVVKVTVTVSGSVWYVSTGGNDTNNGQSWTNAFRNIQTAIDSASDGDEIKVASGNELAPAIYYEQLDMKGKSLNIHSEDSDSSDGTLTDWQLAENTIIDAQKHGTVIVFRGNETTPSTGHNCKGLTIRNGGPSGDGLELHLEFDNETVTDTSDRERSLSVLGPTWLQEGVMSFDGDDYLEITDYKGVVGRNSRTCSAWINTTQSTYSIFCSWGYAGTGQKWMFGAEPTGELSVGCWGGKIVGTDKIKDGNWHHVAAVLEDDRSPNLTEIRLYVDGVPQMTTCSNYTGNPPAVNTGPAENVHIGARFAEVAGVVPVYYAGLMDDMRIYSRALGTDEIEDLATYPDQGLALHLKMDDLSGVYTSDSSEYGFDGQVTGASSTGGYLNSALQFGAGCYIDFDGHPGVDLHKRISMAVWVKISNPDLNQAMRIISKKLSWNDDDGYQLEYNPYANRVALLGSGDDYAYADNINLDTNWHHIAAIADGQTGKIYIDGVNRTTNATMDEVAASIHPLRVGRQTDGTCCQYEGALDDLRIYNRPLTLDEIQFLSNHHPNLKAYYKFDDVASPWSDHSGNSNHAIQHNGASQASNGVFGQCASFTAANSTYLTVSGTDSYSQYSISLWYKTTETTQKAIFQNSYSIPASDAAGRPQISTYGYRSIAYCGDGYHTGGVLKYLTSTANEVNLWHHLVLTVDTTTSTMSLYEDGVLSQTRTDMPTNNLNLASIEFGSRSTKNNYFTGCLDEIQIYNKVLTPQEVLLLATPFQPESTGTKQCVGRWKLDGDTESANGIYNSQFVGTLAYEQGYLGQSTAIQVDSGYVKVDNNSQLDFPGAFTISAWAQPSMSISASGRIVYRCDVGTYDGYMLTYTPTGWLFICIRNTPTNYVAAYSDTEPAKGLWSHIVGRRDENGLMTLFVNGIKQSGTAVMRGPIDSEGDLLFGTDFNTNFDFVGNIDEVSLYNYALSDLQIRQEYERSKFASGGGIKGNAINADIIKCIITNNISSDNGGGISWLNGTIANCRIMNNNAENTNGGGLADCNGNIVNCVITENAAVNAGAFLGDTAAALGSIINCTIANNAASTSIGGIKDYSGTITNSILWGNTDSISTTVQDKQVSGGLPVVSYSCIQDDTVDANYTGIGNIDDDPEFIGEYYHLSPTSLCIDAGNKESEYFNEPDWDGGRINLGAYGNTPEATASKDTDQDGLSNPIEIREGLNPDYIDSDNDGLVDGMGGIVLKDAYPDGIDRDGDDRVDGELDYGTDPSDPDSDNDGVNDGDEILRYSDPNNQTSTSVQWKVNSIGSIGGDGLEWSSAFKYLQDALTNPLLIAGDEVWVAQGTYYPDVSSIFDGSEWNVIDTNERGDSFVLLDGVELYGGFAGDESGNGQRKPGLYKTILNGDIKLDDGSGLTGSNNAYHVVIGSDNSILDGFTVMRGCAENTGATVGGGGLLVDDIAMTVRNCHFFCNNAGNDRHGGGIYNSGNLTLINCVFSGNTCSTDGDSPLYGNGGAIYNTETGVLQVINCTIGDNLAANGGGIYSSNVSVSPCPVQVENCIFWNNLNADGTINQDAQIFYPVSSSGSVVYSCIHHLLDGGGLDNGTNVQNNPLFISPGSWIGLGLPDSITLNATIRDFKGFYIDNNRNTRSTDPNAHPDFERNTVNAETGIVEPSLDGDGKPVYALGDNPNYSGQTTHGRDAFNAWYNDSRKYNLSKQTSITLQKTSNATYEFKDETYFPINGELFDAQQPGPYRDASGTYQNFHFTTEIHTTFHWDQTSEFFELFGSDDDLFVFIAGQLILDLGGVHGAASKKLQIMPDGNIQLYNYSNGNWNPAGDPLNLNLQEGTHNFDLFFAERRTTESHLQFKTSMKFTSTFTPGDYHLQGESPCIDAGDNAPILNFGVLTDCDGRNRRFDDINTEPDTGDGVKPVVDMGAHEYTVNQVPVVDAGNYAVLVLPEYLALAAAASDPDDGPNPLTYAWTKVEGPGTVDFDPATPDIIESTSSLLNPTVAFSCAGAYQLKLEVCDGVEYAYDTTTIVVNPANILPTVDAGADKTVAVGESVYLDAAASDPDQDELFYNWTCSGPGSAAYNPSGTVLNPAVSFNKAGAYTLELSVDDGSGLSVEDTVTIYVIAIDAGPNRDLLYAGDPVALTLSAQHYGFRTPAADVIWTCKDTLGAGWAQVEQLPNSSANITLPVEGTYLIEARCSQDSVETVDYVQITVSPTMMLNHAPTVVAREKTGQSNSSLTRQLEAVVTDDGKGNPDGHLAAEWMLIESDGGTVDFGQYSAANPNVVATFSQGGHYVLKLTADDGDKKTDALVAVTVLSGNHAPTVDITKETVTISANSLFGQYNVRVTDLTDVAVNDQDGDTCTVYWTLSEESPSSTLNIGDGSSLNALLNFLAMGTYELILTVSDGIDSASDTISITLQQPGDSELLSVFAGEDKKVIYPAKTQLLEASVQYSDGSPYPVDQLGNLIWSKASGPGNVLFYEPGTLTPNAGKLDPDAAFEKAGHYVLRLSAEDLNGAVYFDELCVEVKYDKVLSGGEAHSLVVDEDGFVWASGYNGKGTLGDGTGTNSYSFKRVLAGEQSDGPRLSNMVSVAAGWFHSVALGQDGDVWCWGLKSCLGTGESSFEDYISEPQHVHSGQQNPSGFLKNIVSVAAGRSGAHTLAIDKDKHVWSWGDNEDGQLGDGTGVFNPDAGQCVFENRYEPVQVKLNDSPLENIVAVSGGANHSMALQESELGNYVYTWGSDKYVFNKGQSNAFHEGHGKLGHGEVEPFAADIPKRVVELEPILSNADFSEGDKYWQKETGWTITTEDYFNWQAKYANASASGSGQSSISQTLPIKHGTYTFSAKLMNNDNKNMRCEVLFQDIDSTDLGSPAYSAWANGSEYTDVEAEFTVPNHCTQICCRIVIECADGDTVAYADECSLSRKYACLINSNYNSGDIGWEKEAGWNIVELSVGHCAQYSSTGVTEPSDIYQIVPVAPGNDYEYSADINFWEDSTGDAYAYCQVAYINSQGEDVILGDSSIRGDEGVVRPNSDGTISTGPFTAPNDCTEIICRIIVQPDGIGITTCKADNCELTETCYLSHINGISAGWYHSIACEKNQPENGYYGRVYAWGDNTVRSYTTRGILGNDREDSSAKPMLVLKREADGNDAVLTNIEAISAGSTQSMALDSEGYVWTWGQNDNGQLGDGTYDSKPYAVKVIAPDLNANGVADDASVYGSPFLKDIVAISAGYFHCLAKDANGNIYSWGSNGDESSDSWGQLGLSRKYLRQNIPQRITLSDRLIKNITQGLDYRTSIQDAVNHAADGDELVVYPATYFENIDLTNRSLILRSLNPEDPEIAARTVIWGKDRTEIGTDYEGNPLYECYDVVTVAAAFASNSDIVALNTTISGFTIRGAENGVVVQVLDKDTFTGERATLNLNLSNNVITNNYGDGIQIRVDSTANSAGSESPVVIHLNNNLIQNNHQYGIDVEDYCQAWIVYDVRDNHIIGNGGDGGSSGIFIRASSNQAEINVQGNIVLGNRGTEHKGIEYINPSSQIQSPSPKTQTFKNNVIAENEAGGLYIQEYLSPYLEILNNTIVDNNSVQVGTAEVASVGISHEGGWYASALFKNNIIWGHRSEIVKDPQPSQGSGSNHMKSHLKPNPLFVNHPAFTGWLPLADNFSEGISGSEQAMSHYQIGDVIEFNFDGVQRIIYSKQPDQNLDPRIFISPQLPERWEKPDRRAARDFAVQKWGHIDQPTSPSFTDYTMSDDCADCLQTLRVLNIDQFKLNDIIEYNFDVNQGQMHTVIGVDATNHTVTIAPALTSKTTVSVEVRNWSNWKDGLASINLAHDYHLRSTPPSPCIDHGDSAVVEPGETDIDGDPRKIQFSDNKVDIGADEVPGPIIDLPQEITLKVGQESMIGLSDCNPAYTYQWSVLLNNSWQTSASTDVLQLSSWSAATPESVFFKPGTFKLRLSGFNGTVCVGSDVLTVQVVPDIQVLVCGTQTSEHQPYQGYMAYDDTRHLLGANVVLSASVTGVTSNELQLTWTSSNPTEMFFDSISITDGTKSIEGKNVPEVTTSVPAFITASGVSTFTLNVRNVYTGVVTTHAAYVNVAEQPFSLSISSSYPTATNAGSHNTTYSLAAEMSGAWPPQTRLEWRQIYGPMQDVSFDYTELMEIPVVQGPFNVPANSVTCYEDGDYCVGLFALLGDDIIGYAALSFTEDQITTAPMVEAGHYGPYVLSEPGDTEEITFISDITWIRNAGVTPSVRWEVTPTVGCHIVGDNQLIPTVTFSQPGTYTFTLTVNQGQTDEMSDTMKVKVYCHLGEDVFEIGVYDPVPVNQPLLLNNACFWSSDMAGISYEWADPQRSAIFASELVSEGNKISYKSSQLHPYVTFVNAGDHLLTLKVYRNGTQIHEKAVTIEAGGTGSSDSVPPLVDMLVTRNNEKLQSGTNVMQADSLLIKVDALDNGSGIKIVCLKVKNNTTALEQEIRRIDFSADEKIVSHYVFNAMQELGSYAPGSYRLFVSAEDKNGNVTPAGQEKTFDFNVLAIDNDNRPFAKISNMPNSVYPQDADEGAARQLPFEMTEGRFIVQGLAYHPAVDNISPDCVKYKFEMYQAQAEMYLLEDWQNLKGGINPDYFVKNVLAAQGDYVIGEISTIGNLGEIDLTSIPNGMYCLLLTVVAEKGNVISQNYAHAKFVLNCPLKIGNVKFSQEDMSIPVGGIDLSVIRTYDSFKRDTDCDFGYGWDYSIMGMDIQLHEQREILTESWLYNGDEESSVRLDDNFSRDVTLTLPDGTQATFMFYLDYDKGNIYDGELPSYVAKYLAPEGVNATLEAVQSVSSGEPERFVGIPFTDTYYWNDIVCVMDAAIADPAMHDFGAYRLTTEDGTQYMFEREQSAGTYYDYGNMVYWASPRGKPYLSCIVTPTGEKISMNVDPQTLQIGQADADKCVRQYNAAGNETRTIRISFGEGANSRRIAAIYAPNEQTDEYIGAADIPTIRYEYDTAGNLWKVHKLVNKSLVNADFSSGYEVLTYEYDNTQYDPADHYVTAINDPRGLRPIQYKYDDAGRLIATIDAKGNEITLGHDGVDPSYGKYEEITDRNHNVTKYFYNARGNIELVQRFNSALVLQDQVQYTYTDTDNPDKPTSIIKQVPDPDAENYPHTLKPSITQSAYANFAGTKQIETETSIDPVGNLTKTTYNEMGNATTIVSGKNAADFDTFTELTTSRTYYVASDAMQNKNLPYLSGVTSTKPDAALKWHSINLTFYDSQNRILKAVQVDIDNMAELQSIFVDANPNNAAAQNIKPHDALAIQPWSNISAEYGYFSNAAVGASPDQPEWAEDASGNRQYFWYDENNTQKASWTFWDDPTTTIPEAVRILNIGQTDDQGRTIRSLRIVDRDVQADENVEAILDGIDAYIAAHSLELGFEATVQSRVVYNSIGKVDYSLDPVTGILTKYLYDETGNQVETIVYESQAFYEDYFFGVQGVPGDEGYPRTLTGIVSISKTLYDSEGRPIVFVGPYAIGDGPVGTETVYNAQGQAEQSRQWSNTVISFAYELELVTRQKAGGGTEQVYDIVFVTLPENTVAANAWSGTPSAKLAWSSNGKIPMVAASIDSETQIGPKTYTRTIYDSAGRVQHTVSLDEGGLEQPATYIYDVAGRQIEVIDPQGHLINNPNDGHNLYASGTSIKLTDGTIAQTINFDAFDFSGNYCDPENPASTSNLTGTNITQTHYSGSNQDYVVDAAGNITYFFSDELGRTIKTQHPPVKLDEFDGDGDPATLDDNDEKLEDDISYTHFGYDNKGRKSWEFEQTRIALVNDIPTDQKKYFDYDILGRLQSVTLPAVDDPEDETNDLVAPIYNYYYDSYGNLIGIRDPKRRLTVFRYDHLGRQTHKYMPFEQSIDRGLNFYEQIDLTGRRCQKTEYDALGRVQVELDYKEQATVYFYNARSQVQYKLYYVSDGVFDGCNAYYVADAAEFAGTVESFTRFSERIAYTYDKLGRKLTETVKDYTGTSPAITYWCATLYDCEGRIESITTQTGDSTVYNRIAYDYHPVTGQQIATTVSTSQGGAAFTPVDQTDYTYDGLGRLETVEQINRNGNPVSGELTQYSYTDVGSRESITLPNGIYTWYDYNAANRLTTLKHFNYAVSNPASNTDDLIGSYEYETKANGMRWQANEYLRYPSGTQTPSAVYTYDNLNRLIGEDNHDSAAGYSSAYVYDLAGNRLHRTVAAVNGTLDTSYQYFEGTDRLWKETNVGPVTMLTQGTERYFAYADGSGGVYYKKSGCDAAIGQFGAFLRGLPSMWSSHVLYLLTLTLPLAVLWPVSRYRRRGKMLTDPLGAPDLRLWHRCLCLLLAYIFLVGPEAFQVASHAAVEFGQISTLAWGKGGRIIEYGYDENGSLTSKTTREGTQTIEVVAYDYNLQNRLARVTTTPYVDNVAQTPEVTDYAYNPDGIRISKTVDGTHLTDYLVDPANHTGYAQVLQETRYDVTNPENRIPLSRTDYVLGDDVISQTKSTYSAGAWTAGQTQYLLYDGHGSTRQLVNHQLLDLLPVGSPDGTGETPQIADTYSYDGYGVMLDSADGAQAASTAAANGTNLLYCGEQYDSQADQYYLRARCYNPMNGLFNRMDDYSGNLQDPQSLHKYAYCHNNPINGIDPSGNEFSLVGITCVTALAATLFSFAINPVGTAKFLAKAAITLIEVLQHLLKLSTWISAAETIWNELADILSDPGQLIQEIVVAILTKICFVFSIITTLWSAVKTLGAIKNLLFSDIPHQALTYIVAVMLATLVISIGVSFIFKKIGQTGSKVATKYWNKVVHFRGKKVYQRDDLIDPNFKGADGRTNLQRMQDGNAPLGPDGEPINLHHLIQTDDSAVAEVTTTFHTVNRRVLDIDDTTVPSKINRNKFKYWREKYWEDRSKDFMMDD